MYYGSKKKLLFKLLKFVSAPDYKMNKNWTGL